MSKNKEVKELIAQARTWAGWRVEDKADGWMIYPPDRKLSGVMVHGTPSDHRWLKNTKSLLRQRGAPV